MDYEVNITLENVEPSCSLVKDENQCERLVLLEKIKSDDKNENISDKNTQKTEVKSENNANNFSISGMPEVYKDTYEAYIKEVTALAAIPITKSVTPDHIKNFKYFNLRYYEDKYCIDFKTTDSRYNDTLIRIHSNKLFLISLASGNDIIRCGKDITGINFMINNNDRSDIKLGGKKKKGAKVIEPHTILCQIKCDGINTLFNIRAGVPGRIIEINEFVKDDPDLLRKDPKGYGFLAVVAPKGHPSNYEKAMSDLKLLNHDQYIDHLTKRPPKCLKVSNETLTETT